MDEMKKTLAIGLLVGATLLTGCGSSENFVVTNNNGGIPAPICVDDAYSTNANATLTVNAANGVLANDTPNGATLTFQATSANGGTITGAQDGSFTYVPPASFTGSDTFTYTLGGSGGVVRAMEAESARRIRPSRSRRPFSRKSRAMSISSMR